MTTSLREQTLSAARLLFMERGYEAVGMREIASAVDKKPVQIYRLNLSKSDILAELIIQLNDDEITQLPAIVARVEALMVTPLARVCTYLLELYKLDIANMPLRAVGAAHGWTWSGQREATIVGQVMQLLAPIANWLQAAGMDEIGARCYAIWSLYYVGYRRAVVGGGSAQDCVAEIEPSLKLLIKDVAPA